MNTKTVQARLAKRLLCIVCAVAGGCDDSTTLHYLSLIHISSFDFFGRQMAGKEEQRPRWKRAMSIPNSVLGEAVGEMYVACLLYTSA